MEKATIQAMESLRFHGGISKNVCKLIIIEKKEKHLIFSIIREDFFFSDFLFTFATLKKTYGYEINTS